MGPALCIPNSSSDILEKLSEDFTVKISQGNDKASSVRAVNNKIILISYHGSKSRYRSPTRMVPRRIGRSVSIAYRPFCKIR